uniref:Uncharacterized protein n=1 Tax=Tanacetum cinerariifolium TaxID=118510 RepID=A0A699RA75_TANCI|nr:hypothetical protein [Tanacetum cinerariifolium]
MKCAESLELRQVFEDVVSAGIAKGMSKGLRHGMEHRQAQLYLETIEAYDPEAKAKYIATLQALKDLNVLHAPWKSLRIPDVLGMALRMQSPWPLGLQPVYAADHV